MARGKRPISKARIISSSSKTEYDIHIDVRERENQDLGLENPYGVIVVKLLNP